MNPDKNNKRGCFIRKEDNDTFTVVDYPTWSFNKYGLYTVNQVEPLPENVPSEKNFQNRHDAIEFCNAENMVICAMPHNKQIDINANTDVDGEFDSEFDY